MSDDDCAECERWDAAVAAADAKRVAAAARDTATETAAAFRLAARARTAHLATHGGDAQ